MTTFRVAIVRANQLGVISCVDMQKLRQLTFSDYYGQGAVVEGYLQNLKPCPTSLPVDIPFWGEGSPNVKEYFYKRIPGEVRIPDEVEKIINANKFSTRKFVLPVVLSAIAYFLFFG